MTRERTTQMTRREATRLIGVSAAGLCLPVRALRAQAKAESSTMLTRAIPSTGEKLPVIGLGTWQAFDVELTSDNRRQLGDVLSLFVKLGGRVIDTSPMYGRAEDVIGALTTALGIQDKIFLATKVWTRGKEDGIKSMERSMALLHAKRKARFCADQLFTDGTRSRRTRSTTCSGTRHCGYRQSSLWGRRSLQSNSLKALAGLGC